VRGEHAPEPPRHRALHPAERAPSPLRATRPCGRRAVRGTTGVVALVLSNARHGPGPRGPRVPVHAVHVARIHGICSPVGAESSANACNAGMKSRGPVLDRARVENGPLRLAEWSRLLDDRGAAIRCLDAGLAVRAVTAVERAPAAVGDLAALRAHFAAAEGRAGWRRVALERRDETADLALRADATLDDIAAAVTDRAALRVHVVAAERLAARAVVAAALVRLRRAADLALGAVPALDDVAAAVADGAALGILLFARRGRAGRRARAALEHTAAAVGDGPAARPALDRRAGGRRRRVADAGAEVEQHVEQDLLLVGQVPAAVFGVIPVRGFADADVEAAVRNASAGRVLGRPVRRVERELLRAPVAPGAVLTGAVHELFRVHSEPEDLAARLDDLDCGAGVLGPHPLVHHPVAEVLDARARVRAPERDAARAHVGARDGAGRERRGGADARRDRIVFVVRCGAVLVNPHEVEVAGEEAPAAVHVLEHVRLARIGVEVGVLAVSPAGSLAVRDDDVVE